MKILQSLNSQVLPKSFGRVSRKRLHDGSECFQSIHHPVKRRYKTCPRSLTLATITISSQSPLSFLSRTGSLITRMTNGTIGDEVTPTIVYLGSSAHATQQRDLYVQSVKD